MNIKNHLNLINNHGYDGYIALYKGHVETASLGIGDIVLVQNNREIKNGVNYSSSDLQYYKDYRTVEQPHSEEQIQNNLKEGSCIKTCRTCVGVPVKYLEEIII